MTEKRSKRRRPARLTAMLLALVLAAGLLPTAALGASSNSTSGTALVIDTNVAVTGRLDGSADLNYYKVTIPQNGYLQLRFDHEAWDDTYNYWTVYLMNSAFTTLDSFHVASKSPSIRSVAVGVAAGTYYVKVEPYSSSRYSTSSYQLTAEYGASDNWEREPTNNSSSGATVIQPNVPVSGAINMPKDEDYFKVDLPEPGVLRLKFEHEAWSTESKYWTVTLYTTHVNENGLLTSFDVRGGSPTTTSSWVGLPAGTYCIKVSTYSGNSYYSQQVYHLTAEFAPRTDWEREFNNGTGGATALSLNTPMFGQRLSNRDNDYFTFTLDAPTRVSLGFEHDHIDDTRTLWVVALLDSVESPLTTVGIAGNKAKSVSAPIVLDAGTYYVRVGQSSTSSTYSTGIYTLTVHADVIPPAAVTVPVGTLKLAVGDVRCLTESVVEGAGWSSSNTAVATVSPGGVIQAVAPGTAQVTCVTEDGITSLVCSVQVVARGTEDFLLGAISLQDASGANLSAIPREGNVWVTVPVTKQAAEGAANVLVAAYDANGRMLDMGMADPTGLTQGQSMQLRFSMKAAGAARFKAFAVGGLADFTPLADAVEYPAR